MIFIVDFISIYFIRLVRLVSIRVIIFSTSYMINEKFYSRFIILVFFFILSMFLLILSPNFISLLLGWDGLGVTSYLLVIFYQRNKSYNAGILTALTNRLGDVGILIIISIIVYFNSWDYIIFNSNRTYLPNFIIYLIIISACTKRAQIPFSAWLPAAIAAPTPVSSLVHSSTLVTAGVYLLIRINLIIIEINITKFLFIIGIITIIIAGMTAIIEIDIKKIIALSTLRQLGIMMLILGSGNPILSFFHLISHAFFKAMLFMCAGIIIHNIKDYQDIRKMGLRFFNLNFSISIIIIANIRLCGLPFLRGFYSKDLIIEIIIMKGINIIIFFILILGTILTVIYSCRLNFLVAINFIKVESYFFMSEKSTYIILGILFLLPFSILGGIIISWNLISSNKIIFIPFWIKSILIPLIISRIILYNFMFSNIFSLIKNYFSWFFRNMWFLPISINISLRKNFISNSSFSFKIIEISWAETVLYKNLYISFNNFNFRKFIDYFSFIYVFQTIELISVSVVLIIFLN